MTKEHPITPPPELVRQWMERTEYDEHTWFYESYTAEQAAANNSPCAVCGRARALLASSSYQDDATLKSIREHTPRYRMSVIISTNDVCIDTRMHVIWLALNSNTEILESVSLPEKLPPCKNS